LAPYDNDKSGAEAAGYVGNVKLITLSREPKLSMPDGLGCDIPDIRAMPPRAMPYACTTDVAAPRTA